jgi:hypothetical protein
MFKPIRFLHCAGAALLAGALSLTFARADERHFTYSYEADSILPKGGMEFEQWVTNRSGKEDGVYSRWDIRSELEYGITDRLTTALYLNFTSEYEDLEGLESEHEFEFKGVSSEWKYQVLSPHRSPIGILLYGEVTYSGEEFELEEKIIFSKNFGDKWIAAVNVIFEQEWEFEAEETEEEGAFELTGGIAYRVTPQFSVGVEARNARAYPEFEEEESSAWFVGPNLHFATEKWWATLTVLPQVTDVLDEHERIETRLLVGISF